MQTVKTVLKVYVLGGSIRVQLGYLREEQEYTPLVQMTGKVYWSTAWEFSWAADKFLLIDRNIYQTSQLPFDLDKFMLADYQHVAHVTKLAWLVDILIEG